MDDYTKNQNRSGEASFNAIDWDCILRDLWKYWWMILLAALTAALLVGGIRQLSYKPQYRSSTAFIIGRSGFSYQQIYDNLTQAETTTKQYSQVVNSSILRGRVCEELGLPAFDAAVDVSTVESTNLMILSVTADTPRKAFLIDQSIRRNALNLMGLFMEGATMMELEAANIPQQPVSSLRLGADMRSAALLGAAVMAAILALISFRKDTIKNPEDVNRKVDTKLLGTIYHEIKRPSMHKHGKKKKVSLLLDNPMLSFGFLESYRMLASRVRMAMEKNDKKILMVTSVTENEGKSTVSANLAIALAQSGKKVLLVDCDFRKPSLFKIFERKVSENQDFSNAIQQRAVPQVLSFKREPDLFLLLCRKARAKPWEKEAQEYLAETVRRMSEKLDYVIVDSGPMALVSDSEEYAGWADACLLVIHQDRMEASYINDAIDNLEDAGTELIGCVLNGVRSGLFGRSRGRSRYSAYYRRQAANGGEQRA